VNTKTLVEILNEPLREEGYLRKAQAWYRFTPDCIMVVDLQKSDFGGKYYINLAVLLRALDATPVPKEHKCHLRVRVGQLVDDDERSTLKKYLDLEDGSVTTEERRVGLQRVLREIALPTLAEVSSLDAVKRKFEKDGLRRFAVTVRARQFLAGC
jgi:hypothetical protein